MAAEAFRAEIGCVLTDASIAHVAALLADPTRATILWALADGRARPAGELARQAGVNASTASEHLARLLAGGLVGVERSGRHRYYRIAGEPVVALLEAMGALARPAAAVAFRPAAAARAVHHARTCYDHLAGSLGVAVTRALEQRGALVLAAGQFDVPAAAAAFYADRLGIDVAAARCGRRQFAKACLDWTERTHHVAGALGAALLARFLVLGWLERTEGSRALRVTRAGRRGFRDVLDVDALGSRYEARAETAATRPSIRGVRRAR